MIHIDKNGDVIGSFDPPQGHGMTVDSKGFIYLGNVVGGMGNVRKYDPKPARWSPNYLAHRKCRRAEVEATPLLRDRALQATAATGQLLDFSRVGAPNPIPRLERPGMRPRPLSAQSIPRRRR